MRVRAMTATGDMTFGNGTGNFLINSPAAVAQLCLTRINLWQGQWFLDQTAGAPWLTQVLGKNSQATYDAAITSIILGTQGAIGLENYSSTLNNGDRNLTFSATLITQYGTTDITGTV